MKEETPSAGSPTDVALAIKAQAAKVHCIARQAEPLPLDGLRDETAALQALIAEAARMERLGVDMAALPEAEPEDRSPPRRVAG